MQIAARRRHGRAPSAAWRSDQSYFQHSIKTVYPFALSREVEHWSMTTLREKLIKIGAKIVRHGRYVTFQMAEVAVPPDLFADILRRIDRLRPRPMPT